MSAQTVLGDRCLPAGRAPIEWIWRYAVELVLIAALISFALGGVLVWHSMPVGAEFAGLGARLLSGTILYDYRCTNGKR
jgi:hypothetical protein